MKKNSISAFYLKCILLALPFILLLAFYIYKDPFMVLRPYQDYDHSRISQNEGDVSWMKYKMYRNRMHYDSFILGNSCTKAFQSSDWNRYVHGHSLRMFANSEDLGGVYMKIEALNSQPDQPIKNLLLVMEPSTFINADSKEDFMHIMPPEVSHKSQITYQMTFLQGFFTPKFFLPYMKYLIIGKYTDNMHGIINEDVLTRRKYSNDEILPQEKAIAKMGDGFWKQDYWLKILKEYHPLKVQPRALMSSQVSELKDIKSICQHHHTNLKIVISPEFKKKVMNPKDIATLNAIFGPHVVYDFSNKHYLWMDNKHNFYDSDHYRVTLGKEILKIIYQ